ncbi:MAG TPA: alkaline phosphatase family protein [Thermoanaerobaculia bacterium]|nr:alkaline phosphatase family protein [Thermoanaerobaculia bacterium]
MSRTVRLLSIPIAALALALGCRQVSPPAPASPAIEREGPRLLVLIAVDQLAYDYLARFDPYLEGGLRRLLDHGILFEHATYDHALTVTAAGHAALASGLHPATSGIVNNYWFDREAGIPVYSFGDEEHGRSPRNFLGTALPDWLRALDPGARVFAASGKDRAAIAMAGLHPDGAYWYDDSNGGFRTSTYYDSAIPAWVETWNEERRAARHFAKPYEPLPPVIEAADALGLRVLDEGVFTPRFPFALGGVAIGPDSGFYEDFGDSALLDAHVLDFARALIETAELGGRDHLDYLAVGLSSLDLVGHRFGPESPQVADTVLRIDRELGIFLDFLDRQVGSDRYLVALSSDHGVAPVPEQRIEDGLPAQRPDAEDALCFQEAGERVRERFGLDRWVLEGFYLDRAAITEAGVDPGEVEAAIARELEGCDIVERVWTSAELEGAPGVDEDAFRTLYRRSYHPERSPDLMIQLVEYAIPAGLVATHGSPYDYDRHVPVFLLLPGVTGARVADPISIVDVAPTLAGLVGIPVPPVDGQDRSDLVVGEVEGARRRPAYAKPAT